MKYINLMRDAVPKLNGRGRQRHKGQAGCVGVIGGSLEYAGAPYFSAISALKVGADLAHVFCQRDAAVVIKSYSPELIVHPVLDDTDALEKIKPWLERLHVLIIGPGLGRDPAIQKTAVELIKLCTLIKKPLVIDGDGLFMLSQSNINMLSLRNAILTPNIMEYKDLFDKNDGSLHKDVVVLKKGPEDEIYAHNMCYYILPTGGSGRRCGGQGDILCGVIATFFHWAIESKQENPAFIATFAACHLVKQCNAAGYQKLGRSMLAGDMINEIHTVFCDLFENNRNENEKK